MSLNPLVKSLPLTTRFKLRQNPLSIYPKRKILCIVLAKWFICKDGLGCTVTWDEQERFKRRLFWQTFDTSLMIQSFVRKSIHSSFSQDGGNIFSSRLGLKEPLFDPWFPRLSLTLQRKEVVMFKSWRRVSIMEVVSSMLYWLYEQSYMSKCRSWKSAKG
jgi:hypothetical protein